MGTDFSFSAWQTSIYIRAPKEAAHPALFKVFEMMLERGFFVGSNPRIDRDYPILSKDHFAGSKRDLLFVSKKYNTGASIEFYQEINTVNKSGGLYDFDKFEKMPYLLGKLFLLELHHIKSLLIDLGFEDQSDPVLKNSYEKVQHELSSPDRHWDSNNLPDYNACDKDGIRINNGEVKYYRDRKGVLMRGTVYHNINNMWWVIVNKDRYTNLASFELFNLDSLPINRVPKLVKRSGHHNPKSRLKPTEDQLKNWMNAAKNLGKKGRINSANEILKYLYKINWISRCFQFFIKDSGRIGLMETEGNPYFLGMRMGEKIYDPPKLLKLYPSPTQMSGTESGWVKDLREYVVHGKPSISSWFCKDDNGEGSQSYHWPEVRERLLQIGAHTTLHA
ncbi:hypothetical protein D1872_198120 [compost metagenome]